MFEAGFGGSALLHARGECQWRCNCGGFKLNTISVIQPLHKDFSTPVGANLLTLTFGGKGYAAIAALAIAHVLDGHRLVGCVQNSSFHHWSP